MRRLLGAIPPQEGNILAQGSRCALLTPFYNAGYSPRWAKFLGGAPHTHDVRHHHHVRWIRVGAPWWYMRRGRRYTQCGGASVNGMPSSRNSQRGSRPWTGACLDLYFSTKHSSPPQPFPLEFPKACGTRPATLTTHTLI